MLFIKLIRVLGTGLAVGLICHLLYSAGKKSIMTRPHRKDSKAHRKYVESSVIEKQDKS